MQRLARLGDRCLLSVCRLVPAGGRRLSETEVSVESWNGVWTGLVGDSNSADMLIKLVGVGAGSGVFRGYGVPV